MARWIRVAALAEVPLGEARELVVEDRIVALVHSPQGWHALDGVCPHQGGPLGKGTLDNCQLVCPWHGWRFDVHSGQHYLRASLVQPSWPVKLEDDAIWIDLDSASATP